MVIASCSGEGGAALSRRNYGETVAHLTAPTRYPYQFAANYGKFAANVNRLPVDAHMLVALIAPRPVFLQTGDGDGWSDPKGRIPCGSRRGAGLSAARRRGAGHAGNAGGRPSDHAYDRLSNACRRTRTLPGDWEYFIRVYGEAFEVGEAAPARGQGTFAST